jgi:hypothetical protein
MRADGLAAAILTNVAEDDLFAVPLMILPCGLQFQDLQSHGCNLVSATSADQPPSYDHLMRSLLATNRVAAARVVEPASSVDKVSV